MAGRTGAATPEPFAVPDGEPAERRGRSHGPTDRYWRELVGAGHTNISGPAAARVRETPDFSDEELAAAARDVVVQRRNWTPS